MWTALFLLMLVSFFYSFTQQTLTFLKAPKGTKISVRTQIPMGKYFKSIFSEVTGKEYK